MTTTSTYWSASAPGTYYSYQTGDWGTSNTWTTDPSGTTQVGTSIPGNNDKVVILTGRTVTLASDVTTTGLDLTIDDGGFLNLEDKQFTNVLTSLAGQGTLQLASTNFPVATVNTFVNAGGGTTEYFNSSGFTLPATQATYNNLTINAPAVTGTQLSNLTLNGNLYVKAGTFRINDDVSVAKLNLTINGNVTVDNGAFITVGNGPTNPAIGAVTAGGAAPYINYYTYFHTVNIYGNFTNAGTVRFTNLPYPVYNAFPPTVAGATSGAASVYFLGATDNTISANGTTDFYNLIVDKGTDQTYKLTVLSSAYSNFRLFGANTLTAETAASNGNMRKALWVRNGTLSLEGSLIIPSLTEGTTGGSPSSDFFIPANGAIVFNGLDVVVLSTADDYRELNTAYGVAAPSDAAAGITQGGNSSLIVYGKLQVDEGFLSTRESGGIITSNVASGQIIINGGTVDTKQFLSSSGSAQYTQTGGLLILRGRFQRTPSAYATVADLADVSFATLNTARANNGISSGFGSFNLENATNIVTISGGTIRVYDVPGVGAGEEEAFDIKASAANINVTGGTLEVIPVTGSVLADAVSYKIFTNASLGNLTIGRISSSSDVLLSTPLVILNDLSLSSGILTSGNFDISVGRNILIDAGTTYTTGTNTTILNGLTGQQFTVNLAAPLSLNKLTIDKPSGVTVTLQGSQNTIDVLSDFRIALGTLNDNGKTVNIAGNVYNSGLHTGAGRLVLNGTALQSVDGNGIFTNVELNNTNAASAPVSLISNMRVNGALTFSQDKLFDIGTYNLTLGSSATIVNGGANRYIQSSGNAGDGGVSKVYNSTATFTFPVGAPTITPVQPVKYTPASIGFSVAPGAYGTVTVVPVGYEHPNATVTGQSLTYFWKVRSSGFSGIAPGTVIHSFTYDQSDVVGVEANYVPSLYTSSDFTWRSGTNANPPIDIAANLITDWAAPTVSADFLDADYTAGDASFGAPQIYYSRQSGLWSNVATWSLTGHTIDNPPALVPGARDIVIIGGQDSVYLATNPTVANTGSVSCATLQIETGSALDVGYNPSSVFNSVISHPTGNGNFRVTTNFNSGATFIFPGGDFSDFNVNRGTTELYTTNPAAGGTYWLPQTVATYGNLILTPIGGSNVIFANRDVTIYGDLITRGTSADAWFCPTWNTNYPTAPTVRVPKTITINGNLDIQGGGLIWYGNAAITQNFVIHGNVIVGEFSALDVWSAATSQNISIGGSLINNANGLMNGVGTRAQADFTLLPVTFFGPNSASITNTIGTPRTTFQTVTVNKGTSQDSTLTLDIAGLLNTPTNNWLFLLEWYVQVYAYRSRYRFYNFNHNTIHNPCNSWAIYRLCKQR